MKYPNKIIKTKKQTISYANRGMTLENDLNITNKYYQDNNIANINKKATPIKVSNVVYNDKNVPIIKEAYFQTPSTTDYNGIYKSKYIDFEAKETRRKQSFPINNINNHQINHIRDVIKHGGICFIIVRFTTLNRTYLLKSETLIEMIDNKKKSIPLFIFEEKGCLIKENYIPRLDYLAVVDQVY
jgi:recombination protein U